MIWQYSFDSLSPCGILAQWKPLSTAFMAPMDKVNYTMQLTWLRPDNKEHAFCIRWKDINSVHTIHERCTNWSILYCNNKMVCNSSSASFASLHLSSSSDSCTISLACIVLYFAVIFGQHNTSYVLLVVMLSEGGSGKARWGAMLDRQVRAR